MNHKLLVKARPFTTAKTIDMHDHLKPTLRVFSPVLFMIHVGTDNLSLKKNSNEIAEVRKSCRTCEKSHLKHCNFKYGNPRR